jgi:hypothetical protein
MATVPDDDGWLRCNPVDPDRFAAFYRAPGARRSKRFGLGQRVAVSGGLPVFADIDRWRYCPRGPLRPTKADVPAALVTGANYAVQRCRKAH